MNRLLILTLPALLLASTVTEAYGDVEAAKLALGENLPARKIKTGTEKIIPLSRNGKICVGIILAPKAPSVTRLAAEILQKYSMASGVLLKEDNWLFPSALSGDHISDRAVKRRFEKILNVTSTGIKIMIT